MERSKNASQPTVNNRKRTKGRTIQTVPIFDRPKTGDKKQDKNRKVIDHRQVKHRNQIK